MNKTDVIKLGDGQEYTISVFNVGDFIQIEKKYGSLSLDSSKIEPIIFWLWLAIKKTHKDITLEGLYELIDSIFISKGGVNTIVEKMSTLNGWEAVKNVVTPEVKE